MDVKTTMEELLRLGEGRSGIKVIAKEGNLYIELPFLRELVKRVHDNGDAIYVNYDGYLKVVR